MIIESDLKQYHRALALYCLQSAGKPLTAGDLAEYMQTVALASMHDEPCWKRIDAGKVAGTLKSLTAAKLAVKAEPVSNVRAGRMQERWEIAVDVPPQEVPDCPAPAADVLAGVFQLKASPAASPRLQALDPYEHLSREQLLALLKLQDELSGVVAGFQRELDAWKDRARNVLATAGLEQNQ